MITVEYDPISGAAVRDGDVRYDVDAILEFHSRGNHYFAMYATDNIFYALRLAILEGRIPHTDIEFFYNGEAIPINKYGASPSAPKEFLGFTEEMSAQILTKAMNMRRAERA